MVVQVLVVFWISTGLALSVVLCQSRMRISALTQSSRRRHCVPVYLSVEMPWLPSNVVLTEAASQFDSSGRSATIAPERASTMMRWDLVGLAAWMSNWYASTYGPASTGVPNRDGDQHSKPFGYHVAF